MITKKCTLLKQASDLLTDAPYYNSKRGGCYIRVKNYMRTEKALNKNLLKGCKQFPLNPL